MTTPGMQGEVSPKSMGKTASSAVVGRIRRETGPFRRRWEHRGRKSVKTLPRKAVRSMKELKFGNQKGNPGKERDSSIGP